MYVHVLITNSYILSPHLHGRRNVVCFTCTTTGICNSKYHV